MEISALTRNASPAKLIVGLTVEKNCICYKITCKLCLLDGKSGSMSATYFGESGKNMHCRAKEHLSKFNSKKDHIRKESAFIKHLANSHGGRSSVKVFSDYFKIEILKSYSKSFTKCVEWIRMNGIPLM